MPQPVRSDDAITGEVTATMVRPDMPITEMESRMLPADGTTGLEGKAVCHTMSLKRR